MTIVANTPEGTVIFLQSHPLWAAAKRRERERNEAMRRHPSYRARQRAAAAGSPVVPMVRNFKLYSSGNTPA
ncbi:hypothetical protein H7J83_04790 [Mycobacterium mantenii]|uniref:hypothetical protein n=1 Tax=Mycobacterium mantenii TaxID=560555 RepID=UPI00114E7AAD|nr:hypothetical protein [Mycobacterium mantenii]